MTTSPTPQEALAMKLLAKANPVPDEDLAGASHEAYAQQLLTSLLAGSGQQPAGAAQEAAGHAAAPGRVRSRAGSRAATPSRGVLQHPFARRGFLLAGAAAAVAVVGTVATQAWGPTEPALAATPPALSYASPAGAPGGAAMREIAAAAANLPALPRAGAYAYWRTEGWGLHTAVGDQSVTSVLTPTQQEAWITADGEGRLRRTVGESLRTRVGNQQTLDAALSRPGAQEQTFGPGDPGAPRPLDVSTLPLRDPDAFVAAVEGSAAVEQVQGAQVVQAVEHLFARQPLDPSVRSQVWQLVSSVSGLTDRGETTDRLGRTGRAFTLDDDGSLNGLPTQLLLVIDPHDGRLLESDQVLTRTAGKLNVAIPAVISVQINVASGFTATDRDRPS